MSNMVNVLDEVCLWEASMDVSKLIEIYGTDPCFKECLKLLRMEYTGVESFDSVAPRKDVKAALKKLEARWILYKL